ncbi:3-carboxy-cis,cis-muconate cycloisomerase [Rhodobacteraceae bacterium S2214]|nr:3-carboxy-cis,cis-muconate cycloisomerase [Rhodobacteraceae bacterium S2214]
MTSVFDHPWLGGLFRDDDIAAIWSGDAQLSHMRAFEAALAKALEACGKVPAGQGELAAHAIDITMIDMNALAQGTTRDGVPVPNFVKQLRAAAGDAAAAVHTGATSQDVMDTALALTLRKTSDLLTGRLTALHDALSELKRTQGSHDMMGRTRMQAAMPIKTAHRIDAWLRPINGHIQALSTLRPQVECLQLGGAVGDGAAFAGQRDDVATHMAHSLDLTDANNWHTDRTAIADYANRLSLISGTLGKFGQDIALMAQQGIDEVRLSGGGGSSAMPHKSNPVLAELLVTLARYNATQISGMHHALVHEQERSGAAWALEWMILPNITAATARGLSAANELCEKIEDIGCRES